MKAVSPNKFQYRDGLAKKRQRRFLARTIGIAACVLAVVAALGYALFFSGWFAIRDVSATGLSDVRTPQVLDAIHQRLNYRWLGIPIGNNILFFSSSRAQAALRASFPFIETVSIDKKFFHSLVVQATERQPEGIWCFTDGCFSYDHGGVLIAPAPRSSGFLMLTIDDLRDNANHVVDPKFLTAIQTVLPGLDAQNIKIKNITIPADTFTEFDVATANGYPIKFSMDSDLAAQLDALKIYRNQHPDPTPPYQYLDLRFDGRVYFR